MSGCLSKVRSVFILVAFFLFFLPLQAKSVAVRDQGKTIVIVDIQYILQGEKHFVYVGSSGEWKRLPSPVVDKSARAEVMKFLFEFAEVKNEAELQKNAKENDILARRLHKLNISGKKISSALGTYYEIPGEVKEIYISRSENPGETDGKPFGTFETIEAFDPSFTSFYQSLDLKAESGEDGIVVSWNRQLSGHPVIFAFRVYRSFDGGEQKLLTRALLGANLFDTEKDFQRLRAEYIDHDVKKDQQYTYFLKPILAGSIESVGTSVTGFYEGPIKITAPAIKSLEQRKNEIMLTWDHEEKTGLLSYSIVLQAQALEGQEEADGVVFAKELNPANNSWIGKIDLEKFGDLNIEFRVVAVYKGEREILSKSKDFMLDSGYRVPLPEITEVKINKKGNKVKLKWDKVELPESYGFLQYLVQKGNAQGAYIDVEETKKNSYTDKEGISPGSEYFYRIVLLNKSYMQIAQGPRKKVAVPDTRQITAVEIYRAENAGEKVNRPVTHLLWRDYDEERVAEYVLERKDSQGKIKTFTVEAGTTEFYDEDVIPESKYSYTVTSKAVNGTSSKSETYDYSTPLLKLYSISRFNIQEIGNGEVRISWFRNDRYQYHSINIYRKNAQETDYRKINKKPIPVSERFSIDENLKPGKYSYYVTTTTRDGSRESSKSPVQYYEIKENN